MGEFILNNWAAIMLAAITFADCIVSLTPSKKDDAALGYIRAIFNALTGRKKTK